MNNKFTKTINFEYHQFTIAKKILVKNKNKLKIIFNN